MKLVKTKTIYTLADCFKIGDLIQLEDTLSCDTIQCKLLSADDKGIKIIKLSNMETREYTYEQLDRFEAKKLKLGVVGENNSSQKEDVKQPSKAECEKATDEYGKRLEEIIKSMFGEDIKVKVLA